MMANAVLLTITGSDDDETLYHLRDTDSTVRITKKSKPYRFEIYRGGTSADGNITGGTRVKATASFKHATRMFGEYIDYFDSKR
jgi:hypothetical protein